jgi:hypothetical protein
MSIALNANNDGTGSIQIGGSDAIQLSTGLNATFPQNLNAPNTFGFKNRIINGAMGIAQRGTTGTSTGYTFLSVDRWSTGAGAPNTTLSQSTDVPTGFLNSLKVQRPAAATSTATIATLQTIESKNCYDLSNQIVTVSFWAKAGANFSASGGSLVAQVNTGTTADQGGANYATWAGLATIASSSQNITTTWTKYTATGTASSGVLEMVLVFYYIPVGTAGADDSFYITGVQLEKGSTATSFDYRPYGTELQLCQRYYWNWSTPQFTRFAIGYNDTTTSAQIPIFLPVPLRTTPTLGFTNMTSNGTAITGSSVSVSNTGAWITAAGTSLSVGATQIYTATGTTGIVALSSEL